MASDLRIRRLDPDGDAQAVVALVRDVYPAAVINVAAWNGGDRINTTRRFARSCL